MAAAGGIRAAPVTFEFTGTVTCSDFGTIDGGSAVTGSYTFDDGLTTRIRAAAEQALATWPRSRD